MTVLEQIVKPNLTLEEMDYAIQKLGRQPNHVEWAMLEAQWSEHCSYKSSKALLRKLPSKGAHVLVGPGYDAGVVDIGEGWIITLHIESHNHPSAIDPYGGAATGVGGVVRDILSLGTRPIALLDPLRFGRLESAHSRWLFENVVRGIGDYGNCIGVPTVGGEVEFDKSFERNCLVDVVSVGLGRKRELVMSEAKKPGDLVYLVGGSTGRDGIRGASFASRVLTERSDKERSAVQVPDPFGKKLIIEAVLELVKARLVKAMKDLGGGGLTCALSEMAAKGSTGLEINLDKVLTREPGMLPEEILISESQERMALIIDPADEKRVVEVLDKYEVAWSEIATVTNDGRLRVGMTGKIVADMPAKFVAEAPLMAHAAKKPDYLDQLASENKPETRQSPSKIILRMMGLPNIASREWIYRQYDHEVGIRTVLKPGDADSALLRLSSGKRLALTTGGNSRACYLDPYWGTIGAVSEALYNLSATGATPLGIVDHLQYGNPNSPEVYWTFKEAVQAITDYLTAVKVPCIGGKVSFYNEDAETGTAIKPSPVISAIGTVEKDAPTVGQGFREEGSDIMVVGETGPDLGGSEFYEEILKVTAGRVPKVNLKRERRQLTNVARILAKGSGLSAHDCSKGGLAVALCEMAIKSGDGIGFDILMDNLPGKAVTTHQKLFSESYSRVLIETKNKYTQRIIGTFRKNGVPAAKIGSTSKTGRLSFRDGKSVFDVKLSDASLAWSQTIPMVMEAAIAK